MFAFDTFVDLEPVKKHNEIYSDTETFIDNKATFVSTADTLVL